jgi:hypothetical protein
MDIPKPKIKQNEQKEDDKKSDKNSSKDKNSTKDDKKSNKSKRLNNRNKTNILGKKPTIELNKESSSKNIRNPNRKLKTFGSKEKIYNLNDMNEIEIKSNKSGKRESFDKNERKIEKVYSNDSFIKIISENAMRMKKDQLLEQFHYVLDPHQKSAILQEIIELRKKKETL